MAGLRRFRLMLLLLAIGLFPSMGACDALSALLGGALTDNPAGDPATSVPSDSVLLVIENHAGSPVTVTAYFENRGQAVRQTTRFLAATGAEAIAEVLRTVAERITIRAWLTEPSISMTQTPNTKGLVLAQREYLLGVDYKGGDTLLFIVPPLNDCNANLVPDATDIAAGDSKDCNDNDVPDECDIARGVGQDIDGNGILDECEAPSGLTILCPGLVTVVAGSECQGVVPDFTGLVTISGDTPPDLLLTQDPQAGTSLTFGASLDVSVVIGDSAGPIASCTSTVLLVDESAPILNVPADTAVPCSQPTDPESNPSLGFASADDNCDPSPAVTYSDDTSGHDGCQGQILRTWLATDQSGNTASGVQTVTVLETPPPSRVYWTTWPEPDGKIESANSDRTDRRVILVTGAYPQEIDVDPVGGHLYWVGHSPHQGSALRRATLDGADVTILPVTAAGSLGVAVDPVAEKVYWTRTVFSSPLNHAASQPSAAISLAGPSGNDEALLLVQPPPSLAIAIAVSHSADAIYWTQCSGCEACCCSLYAADLNGHDAWAVRTSPHPMTGVAILPADGRRSALGAVYWIEHTGLGLSTIFRASLTGRDVQPILVIPDGWALNLAIDPAEGKLYWTQPLRGKIGRADLDGANGEDFMTGLGPVTGIAVLPPASLP